MIVFWIVIWVVCAVVASTLAEDKGRGAFSWFVLGFLFGPFAVLLLLAWPKNEAALEAHALRAGEKKKCPACVQLGHLFVGRPMVTPESPVVGDTVTLSFPVSYRLPGGISCEGFTGQSCRLDGGETYLEGDEPPRVEFSNGQTLVSVDRQVLRAGTATVQLYLRQQTEMECYDPPDCGMYLQIARTKGPAPFRGRPSRLAESQ
jgi:hypothetical protein